MKRAEVPHIQDGISEVDSMLTSLCRIAGQLFIVSSSNPKLFFCPHKDLGQNENISEHHYHHSHL